MIANNYLPPLYKPLIGCVLGIFVQKNLFLPWHYVLATLGMTVIVAAWSILNKYKTILLYALSTFAMASGAYLLNLQKNYHSLLQHCIAQQHITLQATVIGNDDWVTHNKKGSVFRLRVHEITLPEKKIRHSMTFDCLCYSHVNFKLMIGDRIQLHNITIRQDTDQTAHNNSSYNDFLCKENIIGSIFISTSQQYKLISRPYISLDRWLWTLRDSFYTAIKQQLSEKAFSFFGLIFMGNKQQLHSEYMRTIFGYWGLSHYLARSGLHIILFIMILAMLLGLIPLHTSYKTVITLMLCFLYDLLSWPSVPFVRAYYGILISKIGNLIGLQVNVAHIVALICLVMLFLNPMQLFFLDFQLTFALTFTLIFLSQIPAQKRLFR